MNCKIVEERELAEREAKEQACRLPREEEKKQWEIMCQMALEQCAREQEWRKTLTVRAH